MEDALATEDTEADIAMKSITSSTSTILDCLISQKLVSQGAKMEVYAIMESVSAQEITLGQIAQTRTFP